MSWQHLPTAQQRRFSAGRAASFPCAQHWQMRLSLLSHCLISLTWSLSSLVAPRCGMMCSRENSSYFSQVLGARFGRTTSSSGDLLRIDAVTEEGLLVRRALDADPATGLRRWTDRHFVFNLYRDAELGYVVTDHAAQSRTVTAGLAVIGGTEDRQHAYVALSRGTEINLAYVFTHSPRTADPAPGPRPAPELTRYDRRAAGSCGAAATSATTPAEALTVLAGVLDRDGQQHSATQTRHQALSDVDHLAILHAIWAAETTPARDQAYRDLLMGALPPGYRRPIGYQARWLWRTLRAAELAGLDPARALADAIAERDLAGSRDIAAVLDARLRHRLGSLVPLPPRPWAEQVPALADPERRAYAAEIAALMDARTDRIGEHAAAHPPGLGHRRARPGPAPPAGQARLAATSRRHRRLARAVRLRPPRRPDRPRTRRGRPRRPRRLAPGPGRPQPGRRPRCPRHARRPAVAPARHLPGRDRLGPPVRRGRAAPGPRCRLGRPPGGLRAAAEARAAGRRGDPGHAAARHQLAAGYQALERAYRQRETVFAQTMADRADWEQATRAQRQLAVAADAELRRRHPCASRRSIPGNKTGRRSHRIMAGYPAHRRMSTTMIMWGTARWVRDSDTSFGT
jgi:hypothetical protein